jgi:hypothetical protein
LYTYLLLRYLFSLMVEFSQNNDKRLRGRDALETAGEYNLNVGVGGDNRKKENSEWFKRNEYIFTVLHSYKSDYFQKKKKFLTLICYVLAAIKKEKKKKINLRKVNGLKINKKKKRGNRKRSPRRYSSTPPTIGGTVPSEIRC